jgi:hypothetical protein
MVQKNSVRIVCFPGVHIRGGIDRIKVPEALNSESKADWNPLSRVKRPASNWMEDQGSGAFCGLCTIQTSYLSDHTKTLFLIYLFTAATYNSYENTLIVSSVRQLLYLNLSNWPALKSTLSAIQWSELFKPCVDHKLGWKNISIILILNLSRHNLILTPNLTSYKHIWKGHVDGHQEQFCLL